MKKFIVIDQDDDVENVIVLDPNAESGQRWLQATGKEVMDQELLPEIEYEFVDDEGVAHILKSKPGIGWKKEAGSFQKLTKKEKDAKKEK